MATERRSKKPWPNDGAPAGAAPTALDEVPDELLPSIFLRLSSPLDLVRAASVCKRWRRAIAGDAAFLRRARARSLHAPTVGGHYHVTDHDDDVTLPPGHNPVFVPSMPAGLDRRHLSLDFLPSVRGAHWKLADVRGSVLLLHNLRDGGSGTHALPDLVICDPLRRHHWTIRPPATALRCCSYLGAFLLDGGADDMSIQLPRVLYIGLRCRADVFKPGALKSVVSFGGGGGGVRGWTRRRQMTTTSALEPEDLEFAGRAGGCINWCRIDSNKLISLNEVTGRFSTSKIPGGNGHADEEFGKLRMRIVAGSDGGARIVRLVDKNLEVLTRAVDGGEWVLEKRLWLPGAMRWFPGHEEAYRARAVAIVSVGEGLVVLAPVGEKMFVSMNLWIMQVKRACEVDASPSYPYYLPWPTIRACLPRV